MSVIYFIFRFFLAICFLSGFAFFNHLVRAQAKKSSSSQSVFSNNNKELKLNGILVVFNKWPNRKETIEILQLAKKAGLKKSEENQELKLWSFEWLEEHNQSLKNILSINVAYEVCEQIAKHSFVKYCRPEFIPILHQSRSDNTRQRSSPVLSASCTGEIFDLSPSDLSEIHFSCEKFPESCSKEGVIIRHPFWGQKMIGSDFVREELEGVNNLPSNKQHLISVVDGKVDVGIGTHEELVRNTIFSSGKQSVLPLSGYQTSFMDYKRLSEYDNFFNRKYKECLNTQTIAQCKNRVYSDTPAIANLSFGIIDSEIEKLVNTYNEERKQLSQALHEGKSVFYSNLMKKEINLKKQEDIMKYNEVIQQVLNRIEKSKQLYLSQDKSLKTFSQRGVILIQSSGNNGEKPIDIYTQLAAKDYGAIIVGSVDATADKSDFSQSGDSVYIMAPGNDIIIRNDKGEFYSVDGTSFSTPITSGALGGFILSSGYRPTKDEVKALLKKTAIPHHAGQGNGVGVVNAYKMMRVGKRLYERCRGSKEMFCFGNNISDPNLYNFEVDPNLVATSERVFPQCSSNVNSVRECSYNCEKKKNMLKKLRKAFLLNPKDNDLSEQLACIYSSYGYVDTGKAFLGRDGYKKLRAPFVCHQDEDCVLIRKSSSMQADSCNDNSCLLVTSQKAQDPWFSVSAVTKAEAEQEYIAGRVEICNGSQWCTARQTGDSQCSNIGKNPGKVKLGNNKKGELVPATYKSICNNIGACILETNQQSEKKPSAVKCSFNCEDSEKGNQQGSKSIQ